MENEITAIVNHLQLQPHPEGGFYKETYRCESQTQQIHSNANRSACTAIYFMLTEGNFSAFHRIKSDEIWHFYSGSPIHLHTLSPEGHYQEIIIGADLSQNQHPQYIVPANYWFASEVKSNYALCGCTVSPGFDFADFEMANRKSLSQQYTAHQNIIQRLTR